MCQCQPGFVGKHCEVQQSVCMSSPCQNGGQCRATHTTYECQCVSGYTGTNCEVRNTTHTRITSLSFSLFFSLLCLFQFSPVSLVLRLFFLSSSFSFLSTSTFCLFSRFYFSFLVYFFFPSFFPLTFVLLFLHVDLAPFSLPFFLTPFLLLFLSLHLTFPVLHLSLDHLHFCPPPLFSFSFSHCVFIVPSFFHLP